MASSSDRRSASSGRSRPRKRIVIDAERTRTVVYRAGAPDVAGRSVRRSDSVSRAQRAAAPHDHVAEARRAQAARRRQREARVRARRIRAAAVSLAALILIALFIRGAIALTHAPLFSIERIRVDGAVHADPGAIVERSGIRRGASILWVDKGEAVRSILKEPWVLKASIDRRFPHEITIVVRERTPALVVDAGGSTLWLASSDLVWLGEPTAREKGLPVLRDAPIEGSPRPGKPVEVVEVKNAIAIMTGLSTKLRDRVQVVSAPTVDRTALITDDEVTVYFGQASDVARKERVVNAILAREKGKVVSINVRVVERPTWRGLE